MYTSLERQFQEASHGYGGQQDPVPHDVLDQRKGYRTRAGPQEGASWAWFPLPPAWKGPPWSTRHSAPQIQCCGVRPWMLLAPSPGMPVCNSTGITIRLLARQVREQQKAGHQKSNGASRSRLARCRRLGMHAEGAGENHRICSNPRRLAENRRQSDRNRDGAITEENDQQAKQDAELPLFMNLNHLSRSPVDYRAAKKYQFEPESKLTGRAPKTLQISILFRRRGAN